MNLNHCSTCGQVPQSRDFGDRIIVLCSCFRSPLAKSYEEAVSYWNEGKLVELRPYVQLFEIDTGDEISSRVFFLSSSKMNV